MSKILRQGSVFFMAVAIVSILFIGMEAKANDFVSTNFFFEQGDCEFLEGRAKRLCLLHCEFLECDEAESLNLGPFFSFFHERACNRLLDRYEEQTGVAGPPCFCSEACDIKFDECVAACEGTEDELCCNIQCGNARSSCGASCCFQEADISFKMCLDDCDGDVDCEALCQPPGCSIGFQTCPIIEGQP